MTPDNLPETLIEAVMFFSDERRAHDFFVSMRWPDGVACNHCGSKDIGGMVTAGAKRNRFLWNCKACKKQFTAKQGTIFQDSPMPFSKWLPAVWMVVNSKNAISSCELARALGITQKSAWHMGHRIREGMRRGEFVYEQGDVIQADESYIGAKARNMHKDVKERKGVKQGTNPSLTPVMGLLARHKTRGTQVVTHIPADMPTKGEAEHFVRKYILKGATLHTDESPIYDNLSPEYVHKVVNHAESYVQNGVHTNHIENYWALLKRSIKGTHVHVAPFHLFRYLDCQNYRFNFRKEDDHGRFMCAISTAKDRTLTWKRLTGKTEKK